jgi:hypothetical protein
MMSLDSLMDTHVQRGKNERLLLQGEEQMHDVERRVIGGHWGQLKLRWLKLNVCTLLR